VHGHVCVCARVCVCLRVCPCVTLMVFFFLCFLCFYFYYFTQLILVGKKTTTKTIVVDLCTVNVRIQCDVNVSLVG